jgi:hypothetical protein
MKRRDFLRTIGVAALSPPVVAAAQSASPAATVLYDGRVVTLDRVTPDPARAPDTLWVRTADLPRINGFELKPEGACRDDICIPVPGTMTRGDSFNLSAFAGRVGQRVVSAPAERIWSFGEIPVMRGSFLEGRVAPDVAVPDRHGHLVRLSQFRGKKVLLITWASW